jgi:hypothetical protein
MNTPHDQPPKPAESERQTGRRAAWVRPQLVAYGPISKLTQGSSGTRTDGVTGGRPCL